jgi:hypothetical protein
VPRPPAEPPASLYLGAHHERAFWSVYRLEGLLRNDAAFAVLNLVELTACLYRRPKLHKARAALPGSFCYGARRQEDRPSRATPSPTDRPTDRCWRWAAHRWR